MEKEYIEIIPNWKPLVKVAVEMLKPSKAKHLKKCVASGKEIIFQCADAIDSIMDLPEGDYHFKRGKVTKL